MTRDFRFAGRSGWARDPQSARSMSPFNPCRCHFRSLLMSTTDPWSRPSLDDLKAVLESIGKTDATHDRNAERLDLSVPAEIVTARGSTIPAMTREISRFGIGLLHRGSVSPGDVTVKMASDTREYKYLVKLEWSRPCSNGMFISGGQFLGKIDDTD